MDIKFITPVAMKVTEKQYNRDLKKQLLAMGYIEKSIKRYDKNHTYLMTNWNSFNINLGTTYASEVNGRYLIDHYNPELFLAIAAMTENSSPIVGEYVEHENHIYKVEELNSYNGWWWSKELKEAYYGTDKLKNYHKVPVIKLRLEELLTYFNGDMKELKANRFPFILPEVDAKRIVNIACNNWKDTLSIAWGKDILSKGFTEVGQIYYELMREACNVKQNKLLDEIFGKDIKYPEKGTPMLVRDSTTVMWKLSYADGKGEFINAVDSNSKFKASWKYSMVLDINNLP